MANNIKYMTIKCKSSSCGNAVYSSILCFVIICTVLRLAAVADLRDKSGGGRVSRRCWFKRPEPVSVESTNFPFAFRTIVDHILASGHEKARNETEKHPTKIKKVLHIYQHSTCFGHIF